LTTLGWSLAPLQKLVEEARDQFFAQLELHTEIRRPSLTRIRERSGQPWAIAARRPSRPIDTVVLEEKTKLKILEDINLFWSRESPHRYSRRGIPYRRGYLFSGPPGTGKSSLAFAIAGVFGVPIYCISLGDPELNDEELLHILSYIPRHCILLLEDIEGVDGEGVKTGGREGKRSAISRAGLLNAIDGVTSQEGRILVMTTNSPKSLPPALLRPGRIDFTVNFELASRKQTKGLFLQMYEGYGGKPGDSTGDDPKCDLEALATAFVSEFPDKKFSPASVQGYLLTKVDPREAVRDVSSWIAEMVPAFDAEDEARSPNIANAAAANS
jgi:chaperone BCS1